MNKILKKMRYETSSLLKQHRKGHSVTYNDDFLDMFQTIVRAREKN
jgi:hypothetical protein